MPYTLQDDGTLDTVLTCDECGEEIRYAPMDESVEEMGGRVAWAMADAVATHECERSEFYVSSEVS